MPDYDKERLQNATSLKPTLGLQNVSPDKGKTAKFSNLDELI
jgi:hypothetical protein